MAAADPYIYPSLQNGRPSDFRTREPRDDPEFRADVESRRDVARRLRAPSGTREIPRPDLEARLLAL